MDTAIAVTIATVTVLAYVAAIVYACVQVSRTNQLVHAEKLIWMAVIVLAPLVGALVWGLAGPHPFGLRLSKHPE